MPVTDLSGDDDWLQQFMAGHQAGQAFGAYQPYGPGAAGIGLGGHMPLAGVVAGYSQATPGAPSMGYPALGPGAPQPQPAQQPQPSALGYSLTSRPLPPGAANSLPLAFGNPTLQDYIEWLSRQLATSSPAAPATAPPAGARPSGIGSDANFPVLGAGGQPTTYAAPGQQPPIPTASSGVSRANPANRGVATNRTPGVGAPKGNPSQTPQTANSTRFPTVQYQVPGTGVGPLSRSPIYSTLNLANLFGRS